MIGLNRLIVMSGIMTAYTNPDYVEDMGSVIAFPMMRLGWGNPAARLADNWPYQGPALNRPINEVMRLSFPWICCSFCHL